MWPDRVSNLWPDRVSSLGPLAHESDVLLTVLSSLAGKERKTLKI